MMRRDRYSWWWASVVAGQMEMDERDCCDRDELELELEPEQQRMG
jgi:hypothetical protein